MSKVMMVRSENRRKAVKAVVDGLGQDFFVKAQQAEYILLKPDLVHPDLQLASTHADAVRGVLDVLKMYTDAPIIIGDAAHFGTKHAFRNLAYEPILYEYKNISLCDLQDDDVVETFFTRGDGSELVIRRSRTAIEAPLSISLSPMKTHQKYDAALSVTSWAEGTWIVPARASAGGQVWSREPWLYTLPSEEMHRALADIFQKHPCHIGVIDGILAMEGDGPLFGTPLHMGVALASVDPVSADTVAATLMGLDPHSIGYLECIAEHGGWSNEISETDIPLQSLYELIRPFALPQEKKNHVYDERR